MKWLKSSKMRLVLVGVVAAMVLGGGNAKADFTFGEAVNLGPTVNSEQWEFTHCVSADGLELYYLFGGDWDVEYEGSVPFGP